MSVMEEMKLAASILGLLRCPKCLSKLETSTGELRCLGDACGIRFPVVDGIPVLIDEDRSVFSIDDYVSRRATTVSHWKPSPLSAILGRFIPDINSTLKSGLNLERLSSLLLSHSKYPRVLVIGGRVPGSGIKTLLANQAIELVESDVAFGPRTSLICDAHCLPFENGSFDGVIAQAVLEHVLDPHQCTGEIHRVLKEQGFVYAETPFMVPGHLRQYDFTRFTMLGHRRLFRWFDEIDSGATSGPGMALAQSYRHFLMSFTTSPLLMKFIFAFTAYTSFFLKYFDRFLIDRPGTLDAAAKFYFLGRRSSTAIPDRELLRQYRGGQQH